MELRQLKTFATTAQFLNFTKAAHHLGYAQSTVTSQIQGLESELGTMLFERLGKQIKLTKDGENLAIYATQILKLAAEAKDVISSSLTPKGTLTIGTAESLCTYRLPDVFKAFRSQYPNVELNIRFDICNDYRTHLRKNTVDIVFFLDVPCNEADLITHILNDEPMAVIAAPNHPLSQKQFIMPADLSGQALILTETGCSYRRLFESILTQAGVKPSSVLGVSSNEVIKKFVSDGWGIGFLPHITISNELAGGQLAALPWGGPPFVIKAQLIYHKEKWLSPALRAFIDIAVKTLQHAAI
ncbi:LysR family transcriptional regulator [Sporomusa acidovorans]|uniref:HTH-type transcriptional regulator GltC n=1 Tax=Sporomusa acidovorans (strain ATCC 49682 / DSM 3132 / Mol) TaxID=1123286 RepID=A0ABZ3JBF7_SPOA4|nr:LysR family transcriptional regulator [Sporomusa acidovorans]OZC13346.1 HTH-type transcriptional regulator GltC [Sporomusa acidovorans DSM 3132]SDD95549.1 transcriptional regulator, LysR family [Sporomusa acidovorans]